MTSTTGAWVGIGFLAFACVVMIVWFAWAYYDLKHCQSVEHPLCPTYYCANTPEPCQTVYKPAGAAFRTVGGAVQCQGYTLDPTVTGTNTAILESLRTGTYVPTPLNQAQP